MEIKEYLKQAYLLDKRIQHYLEDIKRLRLMATSVSSPRYDIDRVQTSKNTEAPFVKSLNKIMDLEAKINEKLILFISLKEQILDMISKLESVDEQLLLTYRYLNNMTWDEIAKELHASRATVLRWHGNALVKLKMPENPIVIKS